MMMFCQMQSLINKAIEICDCIHTMPQKYRWAQKNDAQLSQNLSGLTFCPETARFSLKEDYVIIFIVLFSKRQQKVRTT